MNTITLHINVADVWFCSITLCSWLLAPKG